MSNETPAQQGISPERPVPPGNMRGKKNTITQCISDPTCIRPVKSRGMCNNHYVAWYNAGGKAEVSSYSKNTDPLEKLWENTVVDPFTECYEYQRRLVTGYGKVWIDGKWYLAHRLGYSLLIGEIPKGLVLDHMCENQTGGCWNPWHTEPVTQRINTVRGKGSVAGRNTLITHPNCVCANRSAESCPVHGQLHWRPDWRECLAAIQQRRAA